MGFRQIENDIKSEKIDKAAPLLLFGEERFLTNHYEKRLSALFSGGADCPGGLDISVFYGNDAEDDEIMAALDTFPMLADKRIVIVKNHPGFSAGGAAETAGQAKKKKGLADYISQMPGTARLIFTADSVNKARVLYKAVAKYGTIYEFTRLDEADLQNFARKRFKTMGAEIAPGVLDAFIMATGYLEKDSERDLFAVENDVYKLVSFALGGGRTAIELSDIEECLESVLRTDVFAMLNAISTGRKAEAIRLLENSLAGGEENVFRLLSLLTGHFEIMLGYKELSAEGRQPKEIAYILGERSDWRVKKLGGFAQRIKLEKMKEILGRLYETERRIKSGNLPERLALTVLFAEI